MFIALICVQNSGITFKGEQRPLAGSIVEGQVDLEQVAGYAAAVRTKTIKGSKVTASAKAKRVEPKGEVIAVDAVEITK